MNRKSVGFILPALLVLAIVLFFGYSFTRAQAGQRAAESAAVGTAFTYQGRLNDNGLPANGSYDFEFGLYDDLTVGSQIGITVSQTIVVDDGLFTTALDFGPDVFNGAPRYLAIAVQFGGGGFTTLTPRQPLTAVPYASYADKVQPLENVVNVAKSGGDYTTVTEALTTINDASASNPYVIRVAPGVYLENPGIDFDGDANIDYLELKSYVDIEGSGEGITILRGIGSSSNPFSDETSATVRAGNVTAEMRQLTVESTTTSLYATAIRTVGATNALKLSNVTASAAGGSAENFGVLNSGSSPMLSHVTANAVGGTSSFGVYNYASSSPLMTSVKASGSGAAQSHGVVNYDNSNPIMNAVTSSATGGTDTYGMRNYNSSSPTLRDSAMIGLTSSIANDGSSSSMVANTMLAGAVISGAGLNCLDSHDGTGQALDTACAPITTGDAVTWDDIANTPTEINPANVVWVATSGGDYTSVQDALDNITASASNPYLIRVAPGIYTGTIFMDSMDSYVDIEGSGEGVTILRGLGGASFSTSATLTSSGVHKSEVRFLSVESDGTGKAFGLAILTYGADAAFKLTYVTATAFGASTNYGVGNDFSGPTMNNVTATAFGTSSTNHGVHNITAFPTMDNVTATASGGTSTNSGIYNDNSVPTMNNVTATAKYGTNNSGVYNDNAWPTMNNVTATALYGEYNTGVVNKNSSSPTMNNVTATASGGTSSNYGVSNGNSTSPTMNNVIATGSDGVDSYGVYNYTFSSPTMNNVTAKAKSGTKNYGVYNLNSSSPTMNNVIATGSGGANNYGVYNYISSLPTIRDSELTGATNSIYNGLGSSAMVANTMLAGPVSGAATYTCFNTYNASFVVVACP